MVKTTQLPCAGRSDDGETVTDIDVAAARWLVGASGRDEVAAVTAQLDDGHDPLAIAQRLRDSGLASEHTSAVLGAATARRRARDRWADADTLLFTRQGLEQASDPEVSRWRAARFARATDTVLDVCAGIGGDALALAGLGVEVIAVDHDPGRLLLLEHNARARGVTIETRQADARQVPWSPSWWVHADPGRRRGDRRIRTLRDHLPPVPELVARFGSSPGLGIVLSPAVDLNDPDLPDGELEFVQLGDRLVEAVVWLGHARDGATTASATLLPSEERLTRGAAPRARPVGAIGTHLVEVAPAAIRARLHDEVGARIGGRRVAANRALLTVDTSPPPDPWYRARPVETVLPAHPKPIRRWLRGHEPRPLELVLHGVDASPERWWRDLGRPPRGPGGRRLELIRTDAGAMAIVTDARPRAT